MTPSLALTHVPSPRMHAGERTFVSGQAIDCDLAGWQHAAYCQALERLQLAVRRLDGNGDSPDAVFIEDTAVVLDEVAILARMGADSRRREPAGIAAALREYREVVPLEKGTLEGGDVLAIGRTLLVGRSCRTNADGIESLAQVVSRWGYRVVAVPGERCLHLKTACTALPDGRLLVNPNWIEVRHLQGLGLHWIDAAEPWGANVLCVAGAVVLSAAQQHTAESLAISGYHVVPVDISEFAKAEGGVTCLSLVFGNCE